MTETPIWTKEREAIEAALVTWYGRGDWKSALCPTGKRGSGGIDWHAVENIVQAMGQAIAAADRVRSAAALELDEAIEVVQTARKA